MGTASLLKATSDSLCAGSEPSCLKINNTPETIISLDGYISYIYYMTIFRLT